MRVIFWPPPVRSRKRTCLPYGPGRPRRLDAGGAYALEGNHQRECPPRVDDGRGWSRRHIAVPVLHVVPFPKFHTADSEAGSADAGVQSRKRGRAPTEYRNEFGGLFSGYRKLTERIETLYASLEQHYKARAKRRSRRFKR